MDGLFSCLMSTIVENKELPESFSLRKAERLSSKKIIEELFAEGESILQYPLKIVYQKTKLPVKYPAQAAFTVSKKAFKHAVKRNHIKRLLREAYRLNKHIVYKEFTGEQLAIFIVFIGKEIPGYQTIETATKKGLQKMLKKRSKKM